MKLLTLRLCGIGPYVDEQIVDFTSFGHNPIFLIEGPTGAGKSTILNAITFAFYGEAGIDTSQNKRLLCDHCEQDGSAIVILTFEVRGQVYRITRTPKYHPPKLKKEKPETVELAVLNETGEWLDYAEQKRDTDAKIKQIIGLTAEQFAQVIVLPQGQFREIITSSSAVREKIYATLFSTTMYQDITQKLLEQYKALKAENSHGLTQRANLFASVEVQNEQELATKIDLATTRQHSANEAYTAASNAQSKAQLAFDQASGLNQLYAKREKALKVQASLNEAKKTIAQHKLRVRHIEAAQRIAPFQQQCVQAEQRVKQALLEHEKQHKALTEHRAKLSQCEGTLAEATSESQRLTTLNSEKVALESAQKQLTQLAHIKTQQSDKRQQLETLEHSLSQAQAQVTHDEAALTKLTSDITALHDLANTESDLLTKLHCAQQVQTRITERDNARTAISKFESRIANGKVEVAKQEQAVQNAQQARQTLQLHWHQNQAFVLAQALEQDAPCLVCGSTEHPNPAQAIQGIPNVTQQDIDNALACEQTARVDLERFISKLNTLHTDLTDAQASEKQALSALGDHQTLTAAGIDASVAQYTTQIAQAQQAKLDAATLQQQAVTAQKALETQRSLVQTTQITLEGLKGQLSQLQSDYDEQISHIPESYGDPADVNTRLQSLVTAVTSIEQTLKNAQEAHQQANNLLTATQANASNAHSQLNKEQQALEAASLEWDEQLASSELSDEASFTWIIQQADELEPLKQAISEHEHAVTHTDALLTQLDEQLQKTHRPDVSALALILEDTQAKVAERLAARDEANRALQRLTHIVDALKTLDDANQALRTKLDAIEPLAKIANGETDNKVSLHRYVLGVMLDDVLSVASDHLTHMTRGQFHFERLTDSKSRGGRGLDLGVVDNHTGTLREVSSLSGGESFIASMALALALSQVVQEYAGGIQLETLFIDEGFGSLDSEILQLVINVLTDLQASGRTVGLVSHVEHMKDQFPNKILVHKDSKGSRLEVECVA